jgi:hypothetical protein
MKKYYKIEYYNEHIYYYNELCSRGKNFSIEYTLVGIYIQPDNSCTVRLFFNFGTENVHSKACLSINDSIKFVVENLNRINYYELPEHLKSLL